MKTVMTCGHSSAGHNIVHALLRQAGLAEVAASPPEPGHPEALAHAQAWAAGLAPGQGWCADHRSGLLEFWLHAAPELLLVLCYAPPAWALQAAPAGGQSGDAEAPLAAWVEGHDALLKFAARHPGRCVLVNSLAAIHAPAALLAHLGERLGGPLVLPDQAPPVDRSRHPALRTTLARLALPERGEAPALYLELESMAALDSEALGLDQREASAALAEAESSLADFTRVNTQLSTQAQELQQARLALQTANARAAAGSKQAAELQLALADSNKEAELLLVQLHQVQEELEGSFLKGQADDQARQAALAQATKERDAQAALAAQQRAAAEQQTLQLADLHAQLAKTIKERDAQGVLVAQQKAATEQQTRQLADLQAQLAKATMERDAQVAMVAEQKTAAQQRARELAERQTQLNTAKAEADKHALALKDAQARLLSQTKELATAKAEQARLYAAQAASVPAAKLDELKQESDLLLLQLHQVQEELEHYYLTNRRLDEKLGQLADVADRLKRVWHRHQPTDVVFDLREPIDGINWHEAEIDGRWTGPGTRSTLRLPAMLPGVYGIQVDVVDAIAADVLEGLTVTLNGRELPIDIGTPTPPSLVLCSATSEAADGAEWTLTLNLPRTFAPRQLGIEDDRPLGLRVGSVAFTLLEPAPPLGTL